MKKILLALCSLFIIASNRAVTPTPNNAIDLTAGSLFIKDGNYAVGATGNPTISHTGMYDIFSAATTANAITIEAAAQELNLWGVNISTTGSPMIVNSGTNLILNCAGENTITTSSNASPIINIKRTTEATLTLNGDKLTATSQAKGFSTNMSNNTISIINNLKYLSISTPTSTNIAMGGINANYKLKSLVIGNDCVLTIIGGIATSQLVIGKASLKILGTISATPVNSDNNSLYCVTVPRNGTQTVSVKNNITSTTEDYTFTYTHPDDDNYYLYLPNGDYTLTTGGIAYNAVVNGTAVTATLPAKIGDGIIDISLGSVLINEGSYQIGYQPYTYSGRRFTLSRTSSTNSVTINDGADEVILNGVDIRSANGCALNINTGKDLSLILQEGTVNTLSSGGSYAGLQKGKTNGMLTIKGKGTLNASSSGCAGIGAASGAGCSNITIEEGTIVVSTTATYSAAIGGNNACSNIYINGGDITANTYYYAYAIGSKSGQTISNIRISGGKVQLYSGNNLNTANYLLPPNCIITGGTITGKITQGITGALMGGGSVITGGTVTFTDASGNFVIGDAAHPTNSITTDKLYRSQFVVPGITESTPVTSITVDGKEWGCTDVMTDEAGILYLWLPQDDAAQYEVTKVIITVNGKSYTYEGQIDPLDNLIEASSGVLAKGNYFYQVPVNISAKNATVTVTDAFNNPLTDGMLLSSGQLDDNKPRIKVSAETNSGYGNLLLSVFPAEKGTTLYKVTASKGESLTISASASLPTAIDAATSETATITGSDNSILVNTPGTLFVCIYNTSGKVVGIYSFDAGIYSLPVNIPGLYIVKASDGTNCITQKFLIK